MDKNDTLQPLPSSLALFVAYYENAITSTGPDRQSVTSLTPIPTVLPTNKLQEKTPTAAKEDRRRPRRHHLLRLLGRLASSRQFQSTTTTARRFGSKEG